MAFLPIKMRKETSVPTSSLVVAVLCVVVAFSSTTCSGRIPNRERVVKQRNERSRAAKHMNSRILDKDHHHHQEQQQQHQGRRRGEADDVSSSNNNLLSSFHQSDFLWNNGEENGSFVGDRLLADDEQKGCCAQYSAYSASALCGMYDRDCTQGKAASHDSSDDQCLTDGLSFIGVSFSVNTPHGNPYSYQLCDQFPMENIIDREYKYIMSMDEDGWLVGGGYKAFDYSGKMPYIDSSHTELLRIGNLDPTQGGTSIDQVYKAMSTISFTPLSIFPEYLKGPKGGGSGDSTYVPSGDVTLIVSVVETFSQNNNYSDYELFLNALFNAMYAVGGGPCMDDHDTDPHVSMSRGVKFKSSYHQYQYFFNKNMEVAVWQKMYPYGVVIGSTSSARFPINADENMPAQKVGYGNLYFFYDRANITKAFSPNRELNYNEQTYAKLYMSSSSQTLNDFYKSVTYIPFNWQKQSGSGDKKQKNYEHNPYNWNAKLALHDATNGWDLPPNCSQEGETFFGIPLSKHSESKMQRSQQFQDQFDFSSLCDYNYTYIKDFGTNHGWLLGERFDNSIASIVDKDTAHIALFHMGTTNPDRGGMKLSDMIKVAKKINFSTLYIKPAFAFVDENDGHIKLQFEADQDSALGYLYDTLCQQLGIEWRGTKPSNELGLYTNCAMHSAGDRAKYGCGPTGGKSGGFCPQMTIAMRAKFKSEEHAMAYLYHANQYVDYMRRKYSSGVAVGSSDFCTQGGCLALFLNRMDVYQVFKPNLEGSWVAYNGHTASPTVQQHDCKDDEIWRAELERCYREPKARKGRNSGGGTTWTSFGHGVGQMCMFALFSMSTTLGISLFIARAKRKMKKKDTLWTFFVRDVTGMRRRARKTLKKHRAANGKKSSKMRSMEETMIDDSSTVDDHHDDMFEDAEEGHFMDDRGISLTSQQGRSSSNKEHKRSQSSNHNRGRSVSKTKGGSSQPQHQRARSKSRTRTNEGASRGRSQSRTRRSDEPEEGGRRGRSQSRARGGGGESRGRSRSRGRGADENTSRGRSQSRTRGGGRDDERRGRSRSRTRPRPEDIAAAKAAPPPPPPQPHEHRRQLV